ncbi:MAG: outer membrane beta-barrel protein [Treponema sp.]|jgi:TolB-like protein|nr:outer membrane beta-barrel protein [Treponema sp.]
MKKFLGAVVFILTMTLSGLYAQEADLDTALQKSVDYLEKSLPKNATVAILKIEAESKTLSEYIIDELSTYFVNNKNITVVDRKNLDLIQQELDFQMTGEVSEESAQEIGKKLGAQTIILGSINPVVNKYQLNIRALSVETAAVQGMQRQDIKLDKRLAALIRGDSVIPVAEMWKHKWLYLGLRGGGTVNLYDVKCIEDGLDFKEPESSFGFTAAFSATGQITNWLGVQAELIYTHDETEIKTVDDGYIETVGSGNISSTGGSGKISYDSLMLPILAKITFRPNKFLLAGLAGVYLGIPVGEMKFEGKLQAGDWTGTFKPAGVSYGLMFGGNFGYHLGPGVLFVDVRYAMDLAKTKFDPVEGSWGMWNGDYTSQWRFMPDFEVSRQKVFFTIGYEIGFFNK